MKLVQKDLLEKRRINKLQELSKKDSIVHFLNPRIFLQQLFECMKAEFKVYGVRQFSFDLGFEATNFLHLVLNQKRNISTNSATKISKILSFSETEREYFVLLVQYDSCLDQKKKNALLQSLLHLKSEFQIPGLDSTTTQYLSEPVHTLVREYFLVPRKSCNSDEIAEFYEPFVSKAEVERSIEILKKLELVEQDDFKNWVSTQKIISTGGSAEGEVAFRFHNSMLNLAREGLAHLPARKRDFGALTAAVSKQSFEVFKVKLGELMREFLLASSKDVENSEGKEQEMKVVQFNFQCLQFCKSTEEEGGK